MHLGGAGKNAFLATLVFGLVFGAASPARAIEPALPFFVGLGDVAAEGRQAAVAAPLPDGRVLIASGADTLDQRSAEIFDPLSMSFSLIPALTRFDRAGAMAAPLPDGRVLIAGGAGDGLRTNGELFDPVTQTFGAIADEMTTGRIDGFAAPLPDGRILLGGGFADGAPLDSAEIFDPASETFTAVSAKLRNDRSSALAVARGDGTVLIAGGNDRSGSSAEVFDPATETFALVDREIAKIHRGAVAAMLPSGDALIAGGRDDGSWPSRDAGLLDPIAPEFIPFPAESRFELTTERADATAAPLPNGLVLISGGSWPEARHSADIYVSAPAVRADGGEFGARPVDEPGPTSTLTLTNVGAQGLEIAALALTGADADSFHVSVASCVGSELAFGESCVVEIAFRPEAPGVARAALSLVDNEPLPTRVPLSGVGVAAWRPPTPNPGDPPATTPDSRRGSVVGCGAVRRARGKGVRVVCRLNPSAGAWEARLRRGGRTVARRQLQAAPRRLIFRVPGRRTGGYRLELTPLS